MTIYEGDSSYAEIVKDTLLLNDVSVDWAVHHAAVGSAVFESYGADDLSSVPQIDTSDLPRCDVLELDCEGSEYHILQELSIRPRVIIVEIHPFKVSFDATAVLDELERLGYEIAHRYTHSGVELTHEQLIEALQTRVETGGEGLPPLVAAVRR